MGFFGNLGNLKVLWSIQRVTAQIFHGRSLVMLAPRCSTPKCYKLSLSLGCGKISSLQWYWDIHWLLCHSPPCGWHRQGASSIITPLHLPAGKMALCSLYQLVQAALTCVEKPNQKGKSYLHFQPDSRHSSSTYRHTVGSCTTCSKLNKGVTRAVKAVLELNNVFPLYLLFMKYFLELSVQCIVLFLQNSLSLTHTKQGEGAKSIRCDICSYSAE